MAENRNVGPRGRLLFVGSLLLVAFNLRPVFASIGTVLPDIMRDTGISPGWASVLTTAPVLCLGLFAPAAPKLARRWGSERTILACLILLTLGTLLRGLPSTPALFAGSIVAGIGVAIVNVLLPSLIKRDFAGRTALMMGLYTMMLCAGGAIGAAATVPLEDAFGASWGPALAVWSLPPLVGLFLWWPFVPRGAPAGVGDGHRVVGLWRDPLAWQVTLFMAFQSAVFYASLGWLPPILRQRGLDAASAGYVMSLSIVIQIASSLAAPALATRGRDQRLATLVALALTGAGVLGCVLAPLRLVWVSALVLGTGQGAAFALALTMIVLRAPDARSAAQLSGMVQSVGYTVAALASMTAGLVFGLAAGPVPISLLYGALIGAGMICGWGAGRTRFVGARLTQHDQG